jgi:aspartyl-tRNA(Asn)/glutamyl-tRNA(Gln) amidotransferase subunit B
MEKGQMRCEPNISLQKPGSWKYEDGAILPASDSELNPSVEVKNLGSITAVEQSIEFEIKRISEILDRGEKLRKQTRGWDAVKQQTYFQRYKESSADYRYFPEPDIPSISLNGEFIEGVKKMLVELPGEKKTRFQKDYGLSKYDIKQITNNTAVADFFEFCIRHNILQKMQTKERAKLIANWIIGPVFEEIGTESPDKVLKILKGDDFPTLLLSVFLKELNQGTAKQIFTELLNGKSLKEIRSKSDISKISSEDEVRQIAGKILASNPDPVRDYLAGKKEAISYLIGQMMRETKGRVDPQKSKEILERLIKSK